MSGPPIFSNNREAGGGEQVLRVDRGRCHTHRGRCRRAALETEGALNGHDKLEVQAVAGVAGDDVPVDRPPEQGEVADEIEDLVPDELVTIAKAVERAALADDDGVVERAAEGQPMLAHGAEILEEAV